MKWASLPLFVVEESAPKGSDRCFETKKMHRANHLLQQTNQRPTVILIQLVRCQRMTHLILTNYESSGYSHSHRDECVGS